MKEKKLHEKKISELKKHSLDYDSLGIVGSVIAEEDLKEWAKAKVNENEKKIHELQNSIHDKSLETSVRVSEKLNRLEHEIDLLNEIFELVTYQLNEKWGD